MLDLTIAYGLDFLVPARDQTIGTLLRFHGEFAKPEIDFLLACATGTGGTFIDVGANFGPIALPFAKARPNWSVLAIEAHRGMAGLLATNAFNNRLYNVESFHAAAGADEGLARFPAVPLSAAMRFGLLSFDLDAPKETVRMLRVDDIAPPDTRLVKVDVEGFEPQVVGGAARLIDSRSAIWLIEAVGSRPEARAAVNKRFRDAGYDLYWFYAPFATPNSPKAKPGNVAPGDVNVVAMPSGAAPPWPLQALREVDERAPTGIEGYEYLRAYGYVDPAKT
ncbi:FkbM family methyltransferase [Phenylobacterium sp.]|uniref:FkbM family methyltransferase n=1 Tax=Phenylobacterium sp. TaxID=1871053 RepID=UPI00391D6541